MRTNKIKKVLLGGLIAAGVGYAGLLAGLFVWPGEIVTNSDNYPREASILDVIIGIIFLLGILVILISLVILILRRKGSEFRGHNT